MAVPQLPVARHVPGALGHPLGRTARINAPSVVQGDRGGVRTAPGAIQPTPGAKRPDEAVRQVGTPGPGSGDLMEELERQLRAADARLARLRAMDHRG